MAMSGAFEDVINSRPVEVLRIGTKAHYLHEAGLHTLGDLAANGIIERLQTLPGIGAKTVHLVMERLADIRQGATKDGGDVDWDGIAEGWGFNATPSVPVDCNRSFLAALPEVIAAVVDAHDRPMDRLILSERINRAPTDRMTLEAIGAAFNVTRERVRQRQVRLLDNLADSLINDDHSNMPVHFRESFRKFWVRAAQHFEKVAELEYHEFVRGLEEVWGIPSSQLAPFMPLVVAILADGVRIPPRGPDLHPALATVPKEILEKRLQDFPVRRAREGLERAGLDSFGLLLDAARENRLPPGRDAQIAIKILCGVGRALSEGPEAGADAWARGLGLLALPQVDPTDGLAFIDSLDQALAEAARANATSGRAEQIYRLRTSIPRRRRPTLQEVAVALSTHGPSVKREESVLLASLHTQLVEHNMTDAAVHWRPGFLSFFKIAAELYELAAGDYGRFCSFLAQRWTGDAHAVRDRVEGLWAVLSLYPGGRRVRVTVDRTEGPARERAGAIPPGGSLGGVVILRGFRRPH